MFSQCAVPQHNEPITHVLVDIVYMKLILFLTIWFHTIKVIIISYSKTLSQLNKMFAIMQV